MVLHGHGHSGSNFNSGFLEVVCGPMFSGKTEELIRRVRRAQIARVKVQVFKPAIDTRYDKINIVSHSSQSEVAIPVEGAKEILKKIYDFTRVVAIDEAQFFEDDIVMVTNKLVKRGLRVVVAGLDLDYRGRPFGPMPKLLAMADEVVKIQAICTICGGWASKTQRLPAAKSRSVYQDQILVGEKDLYEARCRNHHEEFSSLDESLPLQHEFAFLNLDEQKVQEQQEHQELQKDKDFLC